MTEPKREGVVRVTASTSATDEVSAREADSLPYGAPLPKSKFAKGSEKGTIREAIVGVRLGESPGSTRLTLRLRDSSLPLGMTASISHFSFSIPNLQKNRPRNNRRR